MTHPFPQCHFLLAVSCVTAFFLGASAAVSEEQVAKDAHIVQLKERVAKLEEMVAELQSNRKDDHLILKLSGLWTERSYDSGGNRKRETEDVEWNLAADINSDRLTLDAEVKTALFGRMTVDASKSPNWIDFHLDYHGKKTVLRGIVEYKYKQITLALPTRTHNGERYGEQYVEPPRPSAFASTPDNGVTVYHLLRPDYVKYGR